MVNYGASSLQDERLPNFLADRQPTFSWEQLPVDDNWLYPELVSSLQRICHQVHFTLGLGFLHQVYRRATLAELRRSDLSYNYIKQLPIEYEGELLGYREVRLIRVANRILLATFALRGQDEALVEQLRAHLRRLDCQLGLLANFYDTRLTVTPVRLKQ